MNKNKIILDLCGGTGAWSKPYVDTGYDVRVITLPEYDVTNWREYPELVNILHSNTVYGVLAAPPCTMFSIARNDTTAKEKRDLRYGMKIVISCLEIIWECLYSPYRVSENSLKFWALENPRGYLDRFLGNPVLAFDPFEYGDPYTKKTYLWGMFKQPKRNLVEPLRLGKSEGTFVKDVESFFDLKKHQIPVGYREKTRLPMRTIVRSITPQGFAQAFYEANN